ncbi:MAG: hypothetical protein IT323_20445 [Anaerolineae bacterium]|nr:hypothetical protein [Anaerolineae bacterium]
MSEPLWDGSQSRRIVKRVVVESDLVLQTPAHFGNGDEVGAVLPLIVDEATQQPLLTGASIAGALRSYLWTRQSGYGTAQDSVGVAALLFGGARQDNEGGQSRLIVDDAYGESARLEVRDGVKINPASRTAEEKKLYSFLMWAAGTHFPLRFELVIAESDDEKELLSALAAALHGLNEITLGARKRRGYGRVRVTGWQVRQFDLRTLEGLSEWIRYGGEPLSTKAVHEDIFTALGVGADFPDHRRLFSLDAQFELRGSVLIRASSDVADMGHLRSSGLPVLSGTSLAGAFRARAAKIARTIGIADAETLVDDMFGVFGDTVSGKQASRASRVSVEESQIVDGESERWVQSRVSIDRFTGGALDTALFSQQPHFGGRTGIKLTLREPEDHEIGLLLLVFKDLWTGDLPLGGESSIGRGRLRGMAADLGLEGHSWRILSGEDGLALPDDARERLETCVMALQERVNR